MDYYIDGTIDSIELSTDGNAHFTRLPSAEFLKTMAEGKKKALFIEKDNTSFALLIDIEKNDNGKEIRKFVMPKTCTIFKGLLLEAKNNRNTVRVFVQSLEKDGKSGINFDKPVSITIL